MGSKEQKEPIKMSLKVFVVVVLIIVILLAIIVCGFSMKVKADKELGESNSNTGIVSSEELDANDVEKESSEEESSEEQTGEEKSEEEKSNNDKEESYTFGVIGESTIEITADKNGKKISMKKDFDAEIGEVRECEVSKIGNVVMVETAGGEMESVTIFKLNGDEIVEIGKITGGADVVSDATFAIQVIDESKAEIEAKYKEKTLKEIKEQNEAIDFTEEYNLVGKINVVFVAVSGGEHYGINVYGLIRENESDELKTLEKIGEISKIVGNN